MEKLFGNIFDNYFATRARLGGKATLVWSPDQKALLKEIPERIEKYFQAQGVAHLYKVEGSIGNGNIARVPWVGIFKKEITENAQNGYYVVLLFSEDMSKCYLSLNQGITAVEQRYTKNFAWKKMREAANRAWGFLEPEAELWQGKIPLSSTGDLGRAYEAAAIASFEYKRTEPPSDEIFFNNLKSLLKHYDRLQSLFGSDLHSLFTVTEGEFQQVTLEKAAQLDSSTMEKFELSANNEVATAPNKFFRSPMVAAIAIRAADFACEIDAEHRTFMSRAKKQRYVEAHHLIPISQQPNFAVPLDIVANVVSLCATCHRLLHFGADNERKSILVSLFKQRRQALRENSLELKPNEFLKLYAASGLLED